MKAFAFGYKVLTWGLVSTNAQEKALIDQWATVWSWTKFYRSKRSSGFLVLLLLEGPGLPYRVIPSLEAMLHGLSEGSGLSCTWLGGDRVRRHRQCESDLNIPSLTQVSSFLKSTWLTGKGSKFQCLSGLRPEASWEEGTMMPACLQARRPLCSCSSTTTTSSPTLLIPRTILYFPLSHP